MKRCPDELLADFQQFYHLDVGGMGLGSDETHAQVLRAAALARQLPRECRVRRALAPAASHSPELRMLRQMELNQRLWHWAHAKESERGDEPQPILLDGEAELHEAEVEEQRRTAADVAAAFGLKMGG